MKQNITKVSILLLLFAFGLNNTISAQRTSNARPQSHYSSDGILHTIRTVEGIVETAYLTQRLQKLDDYTGLRLGFNSASFRLSGFGSANLDAKAKAGVDLGVVFGWNLGKSNFAIEPGIYYSMKGGKLIGRNLGYNDLDYSTIKTTMHVLEIPLVCKYSIRLEGEDAAIIQPFLGGFLSFGMAGKSKDYGNRESYETFGPSTDQFDSVDAGLRGGVGVLFGHLYLEAAYDLGLVNLPNNNYRNWGYDNGFDDAIHSTCLSINVGFNF